jgi:hypothetical protein
VLAKGGNIVWTAWLGRHRLAIDGDVVDVRSWRKRLLVPGATRIAGSGDVLAAYGGKGATIVDGTSRRHVLGDEPVSEAWVAGGYLYAAVGAATDVVDLRTGVRERVVPGFLELLGS